MTVKNIRSSQQDPISHSKSQIISYTNSIEIHTFFLDDSLPFLADDSFVMVVVALAATTEDFFTIFELFFTATSDPAAAAFLEDFTATDLEDSFFDIIYCDMYVCVCGFERDFFCEVIFVRKKKIFTKPPSMKQQQRQRQQQQQQQQQRKITSENTGLQQELGDDLDAYVQKYMDLQPKPKESNKRQAMKNSNANSKKMKKQQHQKQENDANLDDHMDHDQVKELPLDSQNHLSTTRFQDLFNDNIISDPTTRAILTVLKYEYLTLVQEKTLFHILKGQDCLAQAKTGTGHSCVYYSLEFLLTHHLLIQERPWDF